ncbi:exonuclease SbcCD subunit D C-terminal domain-containing protein [Myxococcota bacterium]|nr:exonuclease SbcCD subunit D C-terminal domain-containing protein [Myxococcota bacterium]MBU1410451.1 exonuclease SbcCD subunit D C-terminal domain-containing protein [Myxococcota bacterium]MBU1510359.1 exonuclease SbcCD subunit D C-terminal domain-containing protein [Myxococcota bacterium]
MIILHTSDWHLGQTLHNARRHEEFEAFLGWLLGQVRRRGVGALLICGDVFDTISPGPQAQKLYYNFLTGVSGCGCRHVVVVGGNHDSPSFLEAPRELLRALSVHVVGAATANPDDEILSLRDENGDVELIVCAVPFLRDRDVRRVEASEEIDDKDRKLVGGIRQHYAGVVERALALACADTQGGATGSTPGVRPRAVPVVATGHLFASGASSGEGIRPMYVGSLGHVPAEIFHGDLAYVALGHLHQAQKVGGSDTIRYSGSPLPMSFSEASQKKSVVLVDLGAGTGDGGLAQDGHPRVEIIEIPVFRELARVRGDWDAIAAGLALLGARDADALLEVVYDGATLLPDLRERVEAACAGTRLELVRVGNEQQVRRVLSGTGGTESLDDLDCFEVFERCMEAAGVPDGQRPALQKAYKEIVDHLAIEGLLDQTGGDGCES